MRQVDPVLAKAFAAPLKVEHQETGALQRLELTNEQQIVLQAIHDHPRVVILKGRQVYCSTACLLYALMFAAQNPGIKVAIVADTREKAEGLLEKAATWARRSWARKRMGIRVKHSNTKRLVLKNGAKLYAVTANSGDTKSAEAKVGRSFSYGLIVLSEFAYYTRDKALLASLTRSALAGARIVIETTATPAENAFRSIWEKGKGWHRVFLSFEQHAAYQADPSSITEEVWTDLQMRYGFSSRAHAAYWHRMVETDMDGDVHRGLREAPILPEHAFSFAEGRWIFAFDEASPLRLEGGFTNTDAIEGGWRYYAEPDESGCILGIDTASGVGKDASAIAVIGRDRGNLLAAFVARDVQVPAFIGIAKAAVARFRPVASSVETNGIGTPVYQALGLTPGARPQDHTSSDKEKALRMNLVKLAIERGQIAAGPELQHEVKHSVMLRPKRSGGGPVWDGPDDLLNAIGFALVWRRDNPYRPAAPGLNPRTHVDRRAFRAAKSKRVM
jgi:hypothetical protein